VTSVGKKCASSATLLEVTSAVTSGSFAEVTPGSVAEVTSGSIADPYAISPNSLTCDYTCLKKIPGRVS